MGGLDSVLYDLSLLTFLKEFDIICLLETFYVTDSFPNILPNYKRFFSPAKKLSNHGRASGGLYVFVKNYIKVVEIDIYKEIDFTLVLELKTPDKDILFISTYIPPQGSTYYKDLSLSNGIVLFENFLLNLKLRYKNHSIILCGDFNSRCGNVQPMLENDSFDFYLGNDMVQNHSTCSYFSRSSEDKHINTFGKSFTDMCSTLELYIMNGTDVNTNSGSFTYIHPQGNSVVDYFLLSDDLLCDIDNFIVHERVESLHMPISFSILCNNLDETSSSTKSNDINRYIWNIKKKHRISEELFRLLQYKIKRFNCID